MVKFWTPSDPVAAVVSEASESKIIVKDHNNNTIMHCIMFQVIRKTVDCIYIMLATHNIVHAVHFQIINNNIIMSKICIACIY